MLQSIPKKTLPSGASMHTPYPYRRTKTGCLTCRMRRKKCDEAKPMCTGCKRNYLICSWPTKEKRGHQASQSHFTGERHSTSSRPAFVNTTWRATSPQLKKAVTLFPNHTRMALPYPIELMPMLRRDSDKHFFDHYIKVTAVQLAGRHAPQNAFLTHLIPVAYQDSRVVQCLLALSAAQLSYRSEQFEHGARSHYAVTLRNVKHSLLSWRSLDTIQLAGLLKTTLLLCFFEILIGNKDGNFFHHLRASRTLLVELHENRASKLDKSILDLLTEFYAYFAITANLTLRIDLPINRYIPEDAFLSSSSLVELNKNTPIYGVLLGSAHELFGLIMPILRSARHYLKHQDSHQRDINIQDYEKQIRSWTFKPYLRTPKDDTVSSDPDPAPYNLDLDPYKLAGQAYQHMLLVFLYTSFHGPNIPTPSLVAKADAHIALALSTVHKIPLNSAVQTTMCWAAFIAASCMRSADLRTMLERMMEGVALELLSHKSNITFLKQVWEEMDADESVYGPYGIEVTMLRRGINVTCA